MLDLMTDSPRPGSKPAADRFIEDVERLVAADSDFAYYDIPKEHLADFRACAGKLGHQIDTQKVKGGKTVRVWRRPTSKWVSGTRDAAEFAVLIQEWMTRTHPNDTVWEGTASQWFDEATRDPAIGAQVFQMSVPSLGRRFRETSRRYDSGVEIKDVNPKRGHRYIITATTARLATAAANARREALVAAQVPVRNDDGDWVDANTRRPIFTLSSLEEADGVLASEDALDAS